jgi:hypothetical protein
MGDQGHYLRGRRSRRVLAAVASLALAVAACQAVEEPSGETVFFPQPPPHVGPTIVLAALGSGTLALENGCLWLKSGADRDLIIWPPSYRLDVAGGRLVVIDGAGSPFAEVGGPITIGGGELTSAESSIDINVWMESKIGRTIPAACRLGRYWDAAGGPANAP